MFNIENCDKSTLNKISTTIKIVKNMIKSVNEDSKDNDGNSDGNREEGNK